MTIRLLLADDHTMLREGLRRSLENEGFEVVGEAADGEEAVRLTAELLPDIILMDVSMPVLDGVAATQRIHAEFPQIPVVILTMHADQSVLGDAVRAGAGGYLVKDCTTEEVVRTLRLARSGETALTPELAASMLTEVQRLPPEPSVAGRPPEHVVTKREEEVLQLIAEGASTTEVAERLYISVKTVKNHLASIYQKLDSRDRTQAVLRAVRMGIIRLD
ncbi:MAG: two-component system, NarL family, response regulator DegU [Actinomycetota bacterium]|jgi:DNA-binding NarL/FixJ family response regulator|nr:two-component system, NarL family, response regulator DegU [Actinomycetota bacterium]